LWSFFAWFTILILCSIRVYSENYNDCWQNCDYCLRKLVNHGGDTIPLILAYDGNSIGLQSGVPTVEYHNIRISEVNKEEKNPQGDITSQKQQKVDFDHSLDKTNLFAKAFTAQGLTQPERSRGRVVTVSFPNKPFKMVFSLPSTAGYLTEEKVMCAQGFSETFDEKNCVGCTEICQDKECRFARMWIERQSDARIIVRTRGALCDKNYKIAHTDIPSGSPYGEGDWADEWFYIYPDGVCTRVIKIYTGLAPRASAFWGREGHPFECQETIFKAGGRPPTADIDTKALTLISMDGRWKTISYKPYPPKGELFEGANIQIVNLKSRYKPFTIVQDTDVTIAPYYGPAEDHEYIKKRVFVGWPRSSEWGRFYTVALTHIIDWKFHERTRNTLTRVYLLGMTNADRAREKVSKVLPIAHSWLRAPELLIKGQGYSSLGYDRKQKAYIIRKQSGENVSKELSLRINARISSPLINPVFVIKDWGQCSAEVYINGEQLSEGSNLCVGHETSEIGTDLVLWINIESANLVTLVISQNKHD